MTKTKQNQEKNQEQIDKRVVSKVVNYNPDSIELGTPSKGGSIKVYGNYNHITEFKKKVSAAIELRKWANAQVQVN